MVPNGQSMYDFWRYFRVANENYNSDIDKLFAVHLIGSKMSRESTYCSLN